MNYLKFNILVFAALFFSTPEVQAQITGKSTDLNYFNTTIIYKKGDLKDAEILQKVKNDYGLGDIIRIADAPPKPGAELVNQAPKRSATFITVSKPVSLPVKTAVPKTVKASLIQEKTVINSPEKEELKQIKTFAPIKMTAQTGFKAAKITKKKSGTSKIRYKAPRKTKKGGKQRYGCPKF
jgi:hypothetical protein